MSATHDTAAAPHEPQSHGYTPEPNMFDLGSVVYHQASRETNAKRCSLFYFIFFDNTIAFSDAGGGALQPSGKPAGVVDPQLQPSTTSTAGLKLHVLNVKPCHNESNSVLFLFSGVLSMLHCCLP